MRSPLERHASTPAELAERLAAVRRGIPFLVYRDESDSQVLVKLSDERTPLTVGRRPSCDVALSWDSGVSRVHAELERIGEDWAICDGGLSHNGTLVGQERVRGQRRLRDGDLLTFGSTVVAFVDPGPSEAQVTQTVDWQEPPSLSDADRRVLQALCRPLMHSRFAAPTSNAEIAGELYLTVAAVKSRLRSLFERFGLDGLPQNKKRAALAAEAMRAGLVSPDEDSPADA